MLVFEVDLLPKELELHQQVLAPRVQAGYLLGEAGVVVSVLLVGGLDLPELPTPGVQLLLHGGSVLLEILVLRVDAPEATTLQV